MPRSRMKSSSAPTMRSTAERRAVVERARRSPPVEIWWPLRRVHVSALLPNVIILIRLCRISTTRKATRTLVCARLGLLSVRRHAPRRQERPRVWIQTHPSHVRCQGTVREAGCVWCSVPRRRLRRNGRAAATGTGWDWGWSRPPVIDPAVPNLFRFLVRCRWLIVGFRSCGGVPLIPIFTGLMFISSDWILVLSGFIIISIRLILISNGWIAISSGLSGLSGWSVLMPLS
jgi:hypothetical protein